ncbi:predicted protein [Histoplasma mississippiense (nom. inval.)]|nr:predicted protein [Histoplasma mississippiense (nom. inval.)]EDN10950.1 predicted protein [Histoplasma mississippiense (nom. inval.)]
MQTWAVGNITLLMAMELSSPTRLDYWTIME